MRHGKKTKDGGLVSATFGTITFPAVFGYEEGREISVVFPDLDLATSGESNVDALHSAKECLELFLWGLMDDGIDIPRPSKTEDIYISKNECVVGISAIVEMTD